MSGERVLLIDDDIRVSKMLKPMLSEFEFISVTSGQEGFDILEKDKSIDLVISDYRLKGMTGIDVLKRVKALNLGIGVIILTAYGSKDIVIESLEYKADAYIEKPIDFWLLRDKMEMVLKRTHYFRDDHSISQKVGVTQQTLEDQVNKRVTLRELSKKGAFSEKYFSRVFKERTGQSFTQFRVEKRMEKAKKLLENPQLTLSQISEMLGYVNPSAFMKMFKRTLGITPTQYRKSIKETAPAK